MHIKSFITLSSLLLVILIAPITIFAETNATALPRVAKHEMRTNAMNTNITAIKQKADQLIADRVSSLNKMVTRLNDMKTLSPEEKTRLITKITSAITELTNLKTKIDADTNPISMLTDLKSIYTNYRIYAEFEPQTHLLASSDTLTKSINELTQLAGKLQIRITEAASGGNNVDALKTLLTDMQSKIADAKAQQVAIQKNLTNVTPSGFNNNKTAVKESFVDSKNLLKTARADLQTAMQDARKIIMGLRAFKKNTIVTPGNGTTIMTPNPSM